uniref:Uncharacterized protein n=1 Tax=Bracon brevicornis TaxID=1563983 RepID=A0A6V7JAU1_9HYME
MVRIFPRLPIDSCSQSILSTLGPVANLGFKKPLVWMNTKKLKKNEHFLLQAKEKRLGVDSQSIRGGGLTEWPIPEE